jgi:hypothetical protein
MTVLRFAKVVANLPATLEPNTLYLVRVGSGFDIYVSDLTGNIAYSINGSQLEDTIAGNGLTLSNGVLNVGGTEGRISVSANSIDIDANYTGQSSITTVGTLTSGSLGDGFTPVNVSQGGTGVDSLTPRGVLFGNGSGAVGVTAASSANGSFLAEDSSGNPYWTNIINGGSF